MSERVTLQVQCFETSKRNALKKWAHKNGASVRELIYSMIKREKEIQPVIKKDLEDLVNGN